MKSKKIASNIGRFVEEQGDFFYIDKNGKVWSQESVADLIESQKAMKKVIDTMNHYKKLLT